MSWGSLGDQSASRALAVTPFYREAEAMHSDTAGILGCICVDVAQRWFESASRAGRIKLFFFIAVTVIDS